MTAPIINRTKEVVSTMALVPSVRRVILIKDELSPRSELRKLFPEGSHRMDVLNWQMSASESKDGESLVILVADVFYGHKVVDREATVPFFLKDAQKTMLINKETPSDAKV